MDNLQSTTTNHSIPNADVLSQQYLTALANAALPNTVAYAPALYKAQLDYTAKSLSRLDTMLSQLKAKTEPQLAQYQQDKAKTLFVCMIGFYLGDYLAKLTDQPIHWFQGKHYFAEQPNLANTYSLTFVCEINGHLIKPLNHIATALFTPSSPVLSDFIAQSLETISQPTPLKRIQAKPSVAVNTENLATSNLVTSNRVSKATDTHIHPASTTDVKTVDAETDNASSFVDSHVQTVPTHTIETENASYEEKFNINYNSNILAQFKPPILPNVIATVPLVLLWLYQLYGVYKNYSSAGELSIVGLVFAVITLLVLVAIWVHYAFSFISVFDNKVTVTSPFKNQTTRFDKRVRFFHLQGDGQLLGQKDQVLIKSNTESISLQAQDHDALTDLLLEVEENLLVPSILARIHNGETVTFSLVKLNDHAIQYGNVESKLENLGDYDIEDNFLVLYKKDGDRFARIDINSEPNMNSLLMVLDTLKQES